jgi:hypothetical protein
LAVNGILLDLQTLVKEAKEVGQTWTENIRNVYGYYIDDIKMADLDGTIQEIVYKKLAEVGETREMADAKMELFINEMPYAYYNVGGRDNMSLADGAKDVINHFTSNKEFVTGLATPLVEKVALNMMERTKIAPTSFKFAEYGAYKKDANALLMAAISEAKAKGADPDSDGVFVSSSPFMLGCARAVRIKTVAVIAGQEDKFELMDLDAKVKSLKDVRKAVQKVLG